MKTVLKSLAAMLIAGVLGAGCVQKVVVAEVLQQPLDGKIYTRYNIWYQNPAEISCLNIQSGNFIPVGTEVESVGADETQITFRTVADGNQYTIRFFYGERMCSMSDYIRQTFTLESPDVFLKGVAPAALEKIKKGEVAVNMSKKDVVFSYGPPPPIHTPDQKNITWIYYMTAQDQVRLIFRGDKLKTILNVNE